MSTVLVLRHFSTFHLMMFRWFLTFSSACLPLTCLLCFLSAFKLILLTGLHYFSALSLSVIRLLHCYPSLVNLVHPPSSFLYTTVNFASSLSVSFTFHLSSHNHTAPSLSLTLFCFRTFSPPLPVSSFRPSFRFPSLPLHHPLAHSLAR